MSKATLFCLWYGSGLSVHPEGILPVSTPKDEHGDGPHPSGPFPICGPLPLAYVDALKGYLGGSLARRLDRASGSPGQLDGRAAGRAGGGALRQAGGRWTGGSSLLSRWAGLRFGRRRSSGRAGISHVVEGLRKESARYLTERFPFLQEAVRGCVSGIGLYETSVENSLEGSLLAGAEEVRRHAFTLLEGRRLMAEELHRALAQQGVGFFGSVDALLDPLVHEGLIAREPGVGIVGSSTFGAVEWRCRRCLSPNVGFYPCARCGLDVCPQCDDCRSMGTSSGCAVLYERSMGSAAVAGVAADDALEEVGAASFEARPAVRVQLPFSLSPFQQRASDELVRAREDLLVWAACGSGKTEVTLEAIAGTIRRGGRVLFAVPRRDVAEQLGRRLQEAIVGVEAVTLTGGAPHTYRDARLVVSTVHQAVRFSRRFDLVIVDEVDAFPLNREVWLLAALERAKRPGGRLVMMTATPPERLTERMGRGELRCVTLPGRPHGHPLPVPEIFLEPKLTSDWMRREGKTGTSRTPAQRLPEWLGSLDRLIGESLKQDRRVLVFVPSVRLTGALAGLLLKLDCYVAYRPGPRAGKAGTAPAATFERRRRLAWVHAQDRERREKVAAMEAGELDLLISTSILERGVTLPYLDVIVFAADSEHVFDAAALVQMAGRVGRSPRDPSGRVVFFAGTTTPAMREAIETIGRFNEIARRGERCP